jgi:hypothetical protein
VLAGRFLPGASNLLPSARYACQRKTLPLLPSLGLQLAPGWWFVVPTLGILFIASTVAIIAVVSAFVVHVFIGIA